MEVGKVQTWPLSKVLHSNHANNTWKLQNKHRNLRTKSDKEYFLHHEFATCQLNFWCCLIILLPNSWPQTYRKKKVGAGRELHTRVNVLNPKICLESRIWLRQEQDRAFPWVKIFFFYTSNSKSGHFHWRRHKPPYLKKNKHVFEG